MSRPVHCPVCHKTFLPESSGAMPFCSLRCQQIDAKRWLDENYVLPGDLEDESETDIPPPPSPDDEP